MNTMTAKQTEWLQRFSECTDGITYISTGSALKECSQCSDYLDYEDDVCYTEPYFSWSSCDTCGSQLGGNREDGHGWYDGSLIHLICCDDCVMYIANGELPDDRWL